MRDGTDSVVMRIAVTKRRPSGRSASWYYFAAAGCGNLTATEIASNCGSPINSNSTICPASLTQLSPPGAWSWPVNGCRAHVP